MTRPDRRRPNKSRPGVSTRAGVAVRARARTVLWGRVLAALARQYRQGQWRVPRLRERGAPAFLVLVSTLLSRRSRDEAVESATFRLLAAFPTPQLMARASTQEIRRRIYGVGLERAKAEGIRRAARQIVAEFGGVVPVAESDLLSLPNVGAKTAQAVRVFAYQESGIPVDVHVLRVARRLGGLTATTIPSAQRELAHVVPVRLQPLLNPVLVQHGQNICRARRPRCSECPIARACPKIGV